MRELDFPESAFVEMCVCIATLNGYFLKDIRSRMVKPLGCGWSVSKKFYEVSRVR
jgi:hypothetical protein